MRIAVVGGGISGLSAAWRLRHQAEVTVFEPGRLGGCISTGVLDGAVVEEGPDAFLTRVPEAVELCRELGLQDQLVAPGTGRAALWWRGRLRPLPEGLVLGTPSRLAAIAGSGILSPVGVARAALDLVLPRTPTKESDTVRDLVRRRFGAEVADRLVDPLVGGIHAGWTAELGAAETVPQLVEASRRSRSLLLGLRSVPTGSGTSPFLTPRDGLGALVERLVAELRSCGVAFENLPVESVVTQGTVQLPPHPGSFDAAVIATPPKVTARLVGGEAAGMLASIPTASVVLVSAVVDRGCLPEGLSGFLVPRGQRKAMTACSFSSNKWPERRADGGDVVRLSAGRWGESAALEAGDESLAQRLVGELGDALGRSVTAGAWTVSRWPESFPQYRPGHARLVGAIDTAVRRDHATVTLAGSAYRGSGIPACIASGRAAAESALERALAAAS